MKTIKDSIWLIAIGAVCVVGIVQLTEGKASRSDILSIEKRLDRLEFKIDDITRILIK